jgi:hypothetical protein
MFVFIKPTKDDTQFKSFPTLLSEINLTGVMNLGGGFGFSLQYSLGESYYIVYSSPHPKKEDAEMALVNCVNLINAIKMAYERYIHGASVNVQFSELKINEEGKPEYVWHKISEVDLSQTITIEI